MKLILAMVAALTMMVGVAGQAAAADGCEGVKLTLRNKSGDTIRVLRFEHYDATSDSWAADDLKSEVVKPNRAFSGTQEATPSDVAKTRVIFNAKIGAERWSDELTKELPAPKCKKAGAAMVYDAVIWGG